MYQFGTAIFFVMEISPYIDRTAVRYLISTHISRHLADPLRSCSVAPVATTPGAFAPCFFKEIASALDGTG
jgi:hypothetical protein